MPDNPIDGALTVDVDAVIPVFNGERYIAEAIASVIMQSTPPRNLFVVNDGSTDGTTVVVERCIAENTSSTVIHVLNKPNGGLSSARNAGIAQCSTTFIALLDADDRWMPDKLEKQLASFADPANDDPGLVHCGFHEVDDQGTPLPHRHPVMELPPLTGLVFDRLLLVNRIRGSGSGVLVKRVCFETVGLFDENLRALEDWDMWLRICQVYRIACASDDLVAIRRHPRSMQTDTAHMLANELVFCKKWFETVRSERAVCEQWGHMIAENARRANDVNAAVALVERELSTEQKKVLFRRTFGSLFLYIRLKRIRAWMTGTADAKG